ncbi:MAG: ankyrin repeat domain-containing protein [Elusimicrobia bacterium]|nr:ankyrin repeat domain-containing protein [Elusimicrobiota bacterium]
METTPLHEAAKSGDRALVEQLLASGASLETTDYLGYTPLHLAISSEMTDAAFIKFLLDKGANFRQPTKVPFPDGEGYMHHGLSRAIGTLDLEKVQVFLDAGANLNYIRPGGYDALIDAAYNEGRGRENDARFVPMIDFLLKNGIPVTGKTEKGMTALMILSDRLRLDAVQQLIRAGADESQLKWTPLHKAVLQGSVKDVLARLEAGDALDPKDHAGRTPLIMAITIEDLEKTKILWKRGADRNVEYRGSNVLQLAIHNENTRILEWLIANGATVNSSDDLGFSPLRTAILYKKPEALKVLLAAGADVHQAGPHGGNALNDADELEIIKLLLAAGADTNDLSHGGRRALMGLPAKNEFELLTATPREFERAKTPREGQSNPEEAHEPFWIGMIKSGISAYGGKSKYGDKKTAPVWTADRFGQSLTFLPDGRIVLIAGEHEDYCMPDFHIYNDVIVAEPGGKFRIFLYPEKDFPSTDFHSATLVDDQIYIIGSLGYQGCRIEGTTPVFRLDTKTMKISAVQTTGDRPGWISEHRATLRGTKIEIVGGNVHAKLKLDENLSSFVLDLKTMVWAKIP